MIKGMVRDSKVQWSKEYKNSTEGQNVDKHIADKVKEARQLILSTVISKKEEELKKLQSCLSFPNEAWCSAIDDVTNNILANLGGASTGDGVNKKFTGVPPGFQDEWSLLYLAGSSFHLRAIGLAQMVISRETAAKLRKLSVKKDTDVEMAGTDSEKSAEILVKEEVKKVRDDMVTKTQFQRLENLIKKNQNAKEKKKTSRPGKKSAGVHKNQGRKGSLPGKGKKKSGKK